MIQKRNRQPEMSSYEFAQANKFINQLYTQYGRGLDPEECQGIAWLEYAKVRRQIGDIYNREALWMNAREEIISAFQNERRIRNRKYQLEARLSLDQTVGEYDEPVYSRICPAKGNFVNAVCLWYDMKAFGQLASQILSDFYWGEEDWEIMQKFNLTVEEYFEMKQELREMMADYTDRKDYLDDV